MAPGLWAMVAALAGLVGLTGAGGYVFNTTVSAPTGLWQVQPVEAGGIRRGTLVSVCPPALAIVEAMRRRGLIAVGRCPQVHTVPLLKPVAAVAGDTVTVTAGGEVQVNGRAVSNSRAKPGLPPFPAGLWRVRQGEVWLLSSYSDASFDSRYFGPVSVSAIQGVARPVLVRGDVAAMTAHRKQP